MAIVIVPAHARLGQGFTMAQKAQADEHPGRRIDGSQSAASWVGDKSDLKQTIILCSFCRVNFNPRKNHYRRMYVADHTGMTDGYQVNGKCDACKQMTINSGGGTAYVHEQFYNQVCQDPIVARRNARAKAKAAVSWFRVQK